MDFDNPKVYGDTSITDGLFICCNQNLWVVLSIYTLTPTPVQDKQEGRQLYDCPVYKTRQRGPTYIVIG